jgi:signal transduction histidine kinase
LGLGLPLTRALAAANGATLLIDSAPGQGTRATISFGKDRLVPV